MLTYFANPSRFKRLSARFVPWLAGATVVALAVGLWLAFPGSPPDYQQGETVRIMYVHVPAAWIALMAYTAMAISAAVGHVWKHALADVFTVASAPVGAVFTFVCLASGSLWGAPSWGTWWVWDARLTSMLILLLLYLGYMALVDAFDDPARGVRAGAILAMVGWINVPIVKFSVDWWNTLHQPASVLTLSGPKIDPSMLAPLFVMMAAFTLLYATLVLVRMQSLIARRRIEALTMAQAA